MNNIDVRYGRLERALARRAIKSKYEFQSKQPAEQKSSITTTPVATHKAMSNEEYREFLMTKMRAHIRAKLK